MSNRNNISNSVDWTIVWLYAILVAIGILCIFMVEYRTDTSWLATFLGGKTTYSKQLIFAGVCTIVATFILLTDSKLFTALANLLYAFGILLMLATFVLGRNINGSKSWIPLGGGFNLQPAELCKIFTALALAKYLSRPETDFSKLKSQLIAAVLAVAPAVLSIAQHELGLALVYSSFLICMYREGLPSQILIFGSSFAILVIATLVIDPNVLAISLTAIAGFILFLLRNQVRKSKRLLILIVGIWFFCVGTQRFVVPYIFNNVFECYQSTRIYSMVGKEYDCSKNKKAERKAGEKAARKPDDYNVRQSKIAIGSGGVEGKGIHERHTNPRQICAGTKHRFYFYITR
jgi:rod shape determining protein RodA